MRTRLVFRLFSFSRPRVPVPRNESAWSYAPSSVERVALERELAELRASFVSSRQLEYIIIVFYGPSRLHNAVIEGGKLPSLEFGGMEGKPVHVPCVIGGKAVDTKLRGRQVMPTDHAMTVCTYSMADKDTVKIAIDNGMKAKEEWGKLPFEDRAAVFLKAADLAAGKYRKVDISIVFVKL